MGFLYGVPWNMEPLCEFLLQSFDKTYTTRVQLYFAVSRSDPSLSLSETINLYTTTHTHLHLLFTISRYPTQAHCIYVGIVCWTTSLSAVSLGTPENSAIQKLSIIIIIIRILKVFFIKIQFMFLSWAQSIIRVRQWCFCRINQSPGHTCSSNSLTNL